LELAFITVQIALTLRAIMIIIVAATLSARYRLLPNHFYSNEDEATSDSMTFDDSDIVRG